MHAIRLSLPTLPLREYVRWYAQRQVVIADAIVSHPVPARAAPLLEFVFGDRFVVAYRNQSVTKVTPRAVVVGPQAGRRAHLQLFGKLECFVILFQPTGLHQLTSIPMNELADQDYEAHAVLGTLASDLEQRLGNCGSFDQRVCVANDFFRRYWANATNGRRVASAASYILRNGGNVLIPVLAEMTGLSMRQLERRFLQEVGTSPKLYARIARFEATLDYKARSAKKLWTDVAHELGYYDQMHMIHDFEQFTGETPTKTLRRVQVLFREHLEALRLERPSMNTTCTDRLIL